MMKMFFSSMMISISLLMYFINHPLSMGLLILIQTFFLCLISGMLIKTYWFSYILFLTFLGGLLVLFIYVSSVASNEMFSKLYNFYYMTYLITFINIFFIIINYNNMKWMNFLFNCEMMELSNSFIFFNNENKINMSKIYNNQTYMIMMMMIIYLFITLVAVVKITNIFYGPLRSNFY